MDEYERTTHSIRTEEVVPVDPPVVAAPAPVYADGPAVQSPAQALPPRAVMSNRVTTEQQYTHTGPTGLELARRIVTLAFGVLQALLIIRIVLLLLVANRDNDIVQFILGVTSPFVNAFRDMFTLNQIGSKGSVLDVAAIVAIIAWTLVELLIIAVLNLGTRRRPAVY